MNFLRIKVHDRKKFMALFFKYLSIETNTVEMRLKVAQNGDKKRFLLLEFRYYGVGNAFEDIAVRGI